MGFKKIRKGKHKIIFRFSNMKKQSTLQAEIFLGATANEILFQQKRADKRNCNSAGNHLYKKRRYDNVICFFNNLKQYAYDQGRRPEHEFSGEHSC